ncbi:MAG: penicillin-binding protein 1A [Alphaproteobacteria bacterium]|nr:penicillin-binding protein 1A [Alphaproteobacteria bacterium]
MQFVKNANEVKTEGISSVGGVAKKKRSKLEMLFMALFFLSLFFLFTFIFVFMRYGVNLPDYNQLSEYKPPVTSRFYAGDGSLLTEYATEQRIFVPLKDIPPNLVNAFISAEDKNFWTHSGIDLVGIVRATIINVKNKILGGGRRMVGASTITQQVAKNFFLSSEQSLTRKIKEIILALKMERAFSKRHILTLYFNQIFLGFRSYGVAAAALNYFNKSLDELTLSECAFLASLPKAPNNYNPITNKDRAIIRRNWVLDRMFEDGYISAEELESAKNDDIEVSESFISKNQKYSLYFSEEVRKFLSGIYGEEQLYSGGLAVRTTVNPEYQRIATKVLRKALLNYDKQKGWRGAEKNAFDEEKDKTEIKVEDATSEDEVSVSVEKEPLTKEKLLEDDVWKNLLSKTYMVSGLEDEGWKKAIVLSVNSDSAVIGLLKGKRGVINLKSLGWTRYIVDGKEDAVSITNMKQVLKSGDFIFVQVLDEENNLYSLKQVPELNGAMVVLDPHTGRIFAMVGGFSYSRSKFNRATQAYRQPGSTIKPFVYLTAIENGYTPSSVILDAPVVLEKADGELWRPENYDNAFAGEITLRRALEKSKNNPTIRIAKDIGVKTFLRNALKFGVYKKVDEPNLSMALGSGDTTLLGLTSAFAKIINGGKNIDTYIVDRVQDRNGKTVYKNDNRKCENCSDIEWVENSLPPEVKDDKEQLSDPVSLYQIVNILQGVVERGSGWKARIQGKTIGGKTGTSNDQKDVWFIGGTPDLVAGVFLGYDQPKSLGNYAAGGSLAAPVFKDFMEQVLKDKKDIAFRVPEGVSLVRVNRETGKPATVNDSNFNVVLEAFKEGTEPFVADNVRVDGFDAENENSVTEEHETETNFDGIY